MSTRLAEPVVLASAKETLYPDTSTNADTYTVTDTQFSQDTWGGWAIPPEVKTRLAPINTVRLNSGEPDLIGVGMPEGEVLNAAENMRPVVAVEAKGSNTDPASADVTTGIEQAHSRLPEVNLGYVAAPVASISETARSLARDLNVGVVGVDENGNGVFLEPARVVGAGEFSKEVDAIRFQATTHQLTDGSFPVNHPKNYLGYALAVAADGPTNELYKDHVISQVSGGRRGAQLLGLVDAQPDGDHLTHMGAEVARAATAWCGSPGAALADFDAWWGSSTRFTELAPRWAQLARSVVVQYPPGELIINALERLHASSVTPVTLPVLAEECMELNQSLTVEVFLSQGKRSEVLTPDGNINEDALLDPAVYKSGLYFQLKAQLYHTGIVTCGGTDDGQEALVDDWQLEHPVQ